MSTRVFSTPMRLPRPTVVTAPPVRGHVRVAARRSPCRQSSEAITRLLMSTPADVFGALGFPEVDPSGLVTASHEQPAYDAFQVPPLAAVTAARLPPAPLSFEHTQCVA